MKQEIKLLSIYAVLAFFVLMQPAHAYLDPGTGSMLLQGLIAAVAGGLAAGGLYWSKIKNFFSGRKTQPSEDPYKIDE